MSVAEHVEPRPLAKRTIVAHLGRVVFAIRWSLIPAYIGLWVAVAAYVYKFSVELLSLITKIRTIDVENLMLVVIGLVDMTMVLNLVVMIAIGGYSTFVREFNVENLPDLPRWMIGLDSTTLKIQMGKSLIGISSVHLIQTFYRVNEVPDRQIKWELLIHSMFLITTLVYCAIAKLTHGHTPTVSSHKAH